MIDSKKEKKKNEKDELPDVKASIPSSTNMTEDSLLAPLNLEILL